VTAPTGPDFVALVTVNFGCRVVRNTFGVGDTGIGSLNTTGTAAGCGRWRTSVPLTGPRHVVPVNGTVRV
jgi:hypothetical protein